MAKMDITNGQNSETPSEREVGTENKMVALACEDGYLRVVSLRSRKKIFELN